MAKANKQYTLITYQAYSPTSTAHILESNKLDSSVKAPFVIARVAIYTRIYFVFMDCFNPLAMTELGHCVKK